MSKKSDKAPWAPTEDAQQESATKPAEPAALVEMRKGEDVVNVDPSCVAAHEARGWKRA